LVVELVQELTLIYLELTAVMAAAEELVGARATEIAVKLVVLQLKTHLLVLLDTEQMVDEVHGRTPALDTGLQVAVALVELEEMLLKCLQ
jgi:hypothetical protein